MADKSKNYLFITKNSSKQSLQNTSEDIYRSSAYGDELILQNPLTSSLQVDFFTSSARQKVVALKNTLNHYNYLSNHYQFSSSFGDKNSQTIKLISIPSIFYGSAIKKGTMELDFFITGVLAAKLEDTKQNGELIETTGSNKGKVAGVVLYNEGFILLTGSWNINSSHSEIYTYSPPVTANPKWIYWGAGLNQTGTISSSFDLSFEGTHKIPTLMMFAHAEKGEFNHSNNPTFINFADAEKLKTSGYINYKENSEINIKNIVKSPFSGSQSNFEKITYITKVGIYDKNKNLIGVAKLATPVKKTENREFTFKLKLDI